MSLHLLLPFLLFPSLVANFVDGNAVRSAEARTDGETAAIRVNFTLQGMENPFCSESVDIPENITLKVLYRVRDGASANDDHKWISLQTIGRRGPSACPFIAYMSVKINMFLSLS